MPIPMFNKGVRPAMRQLRPAFRGTGFQPINHLQTNEDSGTPDLLTPDNALVTASGATGTPLVMDDGVNFLTTS